MGSVRVSPVSGYKYDHHHHLSISSTMFILLTTLLTLALSAEATIQGSICTNTSYYGEVEWVDQVLTCCETRLTEPECTTITETVCLTVSETVCTVEAATECTPTPCPLNLKRVEVVAENYTTLKCETVPKTITHNKVKQVPKNVTKKFCNTLWKVNADGEKVIVIVIVIMSPLLILSRSGQGRTNARRLSGRCLRVWSSQWTLRLQRLSVLRMNNCPSLSVRRQVI